MAGDFRPIETAPRDGTLIEIMAEDAGSFLMRWNPSGRNALVSKRSGIWEAHDSSLTWCEDDGFGPTHWRPALTPAPSQPRGEGQR